MHLLFLICTIYSARWNVASAVSYYHDITKKRPLIGMNYIPSIAVNELEFWQASSWNVSQVDWELGLAEKIGFNSARVFLHNLAYYEDPKAYKTRINEFLNIAHSHNIGIMFVLFDDCWNDNGRTGIQPAPIPGVHNSRWLQAPGDHHYNDNLETYVKDIVTTFKSDPRVLVWDVYNEPGNSFKGDRSLVLLKSVFEWIRSIPNVTQPLTSPVWTDLYPGIALYQLTHSDIITFHNYDPIDQVKLKVSELRLAEKDRPIICTEYMARPRHSTFETILPYFVEQNIAAFNWGFVTGKTQTKYAWSCTKDHPCHGEPKLWFHDVLHKNGTAYKKQETELILSLSKNWKS